MRFATRQEIEYLGSHEADSANDSTLIDEMTRQLDALRRFDQYYSKADWRPARYRTGNATKGNQRPI
jgi:hypothetical protein